MSSGRKANGQSRTQLLPWGRLAGAALSMIIGFDLPLLMLSRGERGLFESRHDKTSTNGSSADSPALI
jgi:hypothetical protein